MELAHRPYVTLISAEEKSYDLLRKQENITVCRVS
ncbi:unnamed protein product [Acanthoscelides obtectus]|uniref:Uncharacterized protein n=1 Tax=Acanthoscelides obtectus TaxID=200917 RepID=A0A9P0KDJ3_ACAOB|nr:unnamed protein product [Acanthoscelides obtectus]CAK1648386.1 hypothetical protein AOBTE_LOCUS15696 [Acanthoscelides obtectus]